MLGEKTIPRQLGSLLYGALKKRTDNVVIIDSDDQKITGGELLRRSKCVANVLAHSGVKEGDRIIVCLLDNVDVISCIVACWHLCATPTVMDFRSPGTQRKMVFDLIGASLTIENRHPSGPDHYENLVWDDDWLSNPPPIIKFPTIEKIAKTPAFFTLSSGTTGFPKAYVQSHEQIASRIQTRTHLEGSGKGIFFTPMTMSFSATRQMVFNYLIFEEAVIFAKPLFSTSELITKIATSNATACALPPPVIRNIAKHIGQQEKPFFPKLDVFRSIGGPATNEDKLAAYKNISSGYRMSYSSSLTGAATFLGGDDILNKTSTAGKAIKGIRIEIVDPVSMQALPANQIGLIKVYSPYLVSEIIEHPQSSGNKETLGDGWGAPGDFGFLDDDGYLTITGRDGDMIVRGGVSIAPQEIENVLRTFSSVLDVAVVGIENDDYGEEIAAFIVSEIADEKFFHQQCMKAISFERRPRIIKIVDQLPYNSNGKLMRKKLAESLLLNEK